MKEKPRSPIASIGSSELRSLFLDYFRCHGHAVVAFWHETLALLPALYTAARRQHPDVRVVVLTSRHHDGRLLGGIMTALGVGVVHGSTARDGRDRGGATAIRGLLDALADGAAVAITPDGPRGPSRVAAPGVAQVAALSGVPVLPVGAMVRHRVRLGTWDRMVLPLPYGRGILVCGPPIHVPREGADSLLPTIQAAITAALTQAEAG